MASRKTPPTRTGSAPSASGWPQRGVERGIVVSTDRGRGDGLNLLLESLRGTPLVWIAMPKSGTRARPRTIRERAARLRADLPEILAKEEVPLMAMLNMNPPPRYRYPDR